MPVHAPVDAISIPGSENVQDASSPLPDVDKGASSWEAALTRRKCCATSTNSTSPMPLPHVVYSCDPCINRPSRTVLAIVHGLKSDGFWIRVRSSAVQAGQDAGINLRLELYDGNYDDDRMVNDIHEAVFGENGPPAAMVVTIPSHSVAAAVEDAAMEGVPVFGFNSGYEFAFGPEGMVAAGSLLGFFAMDEYRGGASAAKGLWKIFKEDNSRSSALHRALYANGEKGNSALDERYRGFRDQLHQLAGMQNMTGGLIVDEVVCNAADVEGSFLVMKNTFAGCPYDVVLLSAGGLTDPALMAFDLSGCNFQSTPIGVFDKDLKALDNLMQGRLDLVISQQEHLQSVLPVLFASLFATTGIALAPPAETGGVYLTGPHVITRDNVLSDMLQVCESVGFPVCPNKFDPNSLTLSDCDCTDRSHIRIGGVVHGITTDPFWDLVVGPAFQAATDFGINLVLERFEPQESDEKLHLKMENKIMSLCQQSEVDGIFFSLPSAVGAVEKAVQRCIALNISAVSINSGFNVSKDLGLAHHIGQSEYKAGYAAGEKMVSTGANKFMCMYHAPGLSIMFDRCRGFKDAISAASRPNLKYLGEVGVPDDSDVTYKKIVEEAVGEEGDWDGYAILALGQSQVIALLALKEDHPKLVAGSFDTSDEIYDAIETGDLLFGVDQQPYLQGYGAVALLTHMVYTKQALLNHAIETGPSFVQSSPSPEQRICEANMFAVCNEVPEEDMNYVSQGLLITGVVLFALQAGMSVFFMVWTFIKREQRVVKMSQPEFLVLIAFGCLVMSSATLPLTVQGKYRYVQDPVSGDLTDIPDESIRGVDAACMASPWLLGLGFVIVFSALFAKVLRVKRVHDGAARFQRKKVEAKDTAMIMVALLAVDVAILLSWQLISPLRWDREVISRDENGYPTESVGRCQSDHFVPFVVSLFALGVMCLIYALYLCYVTRNVSSSLAEGKWISFSILSLFQTLVVGVPILFILDDDNNAYFFVRVVVVFLVSTAVTTLIFIPKCFIMYAEAASPPDSFTHLRSSMQTRVSLSDSLNNTREGAHPPRSALRRGSNRSNRLMCSECKKHFPASELTRVRCRGDLTRKVSFVPEDEEGGAEELPGFHLSVSSRYLKSSMDSEEDLVVEKEAGLGIAVDALEGFSSSSSEISGSCRQDFDGDGPRYDIELNNAGDQGSSVDVEKDVRSWRAPSAKQGTLVKVSPAAA